jgi:hypothetical protein
LNLLFSTFHFLDHSPQFDNFPLGHSPFFLNPKKKKEKEKKREEVNRVWWVTRDPTRQTKING